MQILCDNPDMTLVFDNGNNNRGKLGQVAADRLHPIHPLVPSRHKDILGLPLVRYREANPTRWPCLLASQITERVFSAERVVVATFYLSSAKGRRTS